MDSDTGLINEGSGSSWYDAVDGVFAGAGAPGYNGTVANPFEFMQNDPNMSRLSTGYNPSDAGSAVGLMSPGGSGGSTVPVYGGTQTLGLNPWMLAQVGSEYDEGLSPPAWGGGAGGAVFVGNTNRQEPREPEEGKQQTAKELKADQEAKQLKDLHKLQKKDIRQQGG